MWGEWMGDDKISLNQNTGCEHCIEDYDGYYKPLDKNGHVCVFETPHEKILEINWYGHRMKAPINYCPMCR